MKASDAWRVLLIALPLVAAAVVVADALARYVLRSSAASEIAVEASFATGAAAVAVLLVVRVRRSERARLSAMFAEMQEGVLALDRHGRIALANPPLRELLRCPGLREGQRLAEAIDLPPLMDLLTRARATGGLSGDIELGGLRARRLRVHAAPLPSTVGGLLALISDVTHVRTLETLRRDFIANVSHELRTPLAALRSAVEMLRDDGASDLEAAARFQEIIERNSERLQSLVENLLDLSRIESGEFHLTIEPVEMAPIVRTVLAQFSDRAGRRGQRLDSSLPDVSCTVLADLGAVEQVLANLIDNAVKYAGEGARVTVTVAPDGDVVRLTVSDSGPGIEARHLPRLFERFYRVDRGRSRDLGGTGLGLAIVKHLVEAMRGEIRADSRVGSGSTFTVTLPAAKTAG